MHKPELNGLGGTISSYDADTRYTISWAFDFTSKCERAAKCMCGAVWGSLRCRSLRAQENDGE
jgi:hypothetical protein